MKKILLKWSAIILIAGLSTTAASAQHFYVNIRPSVTVVARPPAPSPQHVWIQPEYAWRGGRYEQVQGYWAQPQHGQRWIPGQWRTSRFGNEWIPGHWVRVRGRY